MKRFWWFPFLLFFLFASCATEEKLNPEIYSQSPECIPPSPSEVTFTAMSPFEGVTPSGILIRPAGENFFTARYPMNVWVSEKYRKIVVTTGGIGDTKIQFFDLYSHRLSAEVSGADFFYGLDGDDEAGVVFASAGGEGEIWEISMENFSVVRKVKTGRYVSGIFYDEKSGRVYFVRNNDSLVGYFYPATGKIVKVGEAGVYPFDLIVEGEKLFVSNWGERSVSVFDIEKKSKIKDIEVGKNPEGMALSPDGKILFVAASDSDKIYEISTATLTLNEVIDLTENGLSSAGVSDVAVDESGRYLFFTVARKNYVGVYDLLKQEIAGKIPVGYYPTSLFYSGNKIFVTNGKGAGPGPNPHGPHVSVAMKGTVTVVPYDPDNLANWTKTADENMNFNWNYYSKKCPSLFPPTVTEEEPIKHVVLIVRENKTYDEDLGDIENANGDPSLTLFGENITPNLHALARSYVNCDNYYSDAENSLQGHAWTAMIDSNDFTEKTWLDQFPMVGIDEPTIPESGSIFLHLYNYGVSFRNYGEVVGFGFHLFDEELAPFIDTKYPFWNMLIPDLDKIKEVIREIEEGYFPEFVYIILPNDHTFGGMPGKPAPDYMVAENDYATGYFVDYISHTEYWKNTLIFIIEDDPQSFAGDHVDAHRSICVAVSPWVKRHYVSSVHYDIGSLYRTIEMILGVPPLNVNDGDAIPMYDIFTDKPDFTPYQRRSMRVSFHLNTWNTPMAYESSKLDFSHFDRAPGLGKILWRIMKGDVEPPPYAKGIDY